MAVWRALAQPVRYGALLAGALPVLAFPAPNLEFLGWIGLVPGLLLMRGAPSRREAAVRAWWFGTGYLLVAMYWLLPNLGPAVPLIAIALGFLWTAVGVSAWSLLRPPVSWRRALAALAVVPSAWLLTEWIRSWQALGGPWAVLGATQWQHPAILALAAAGGVWLVTIALVVANTGIVIALVARGLPRLIGLAAALAAAVAGPAIFALTPPPAAARHVTVALVQPGILNGPAQRVSADVQLTEGPAWRADLIVWGESSVGYDLAASPRLVGRLERLSSAVGAQLLVSQDALNAAGNKSKVAVLIGPAGVQGSYVKTRLVPFGEYVPFRSALGWLSGISKAAAQNMVPGTGAHVLHATLRSGQPLTIGVLICFESAFPDMSRVDTDHGAQLIIYQTADSTFQGSWELAQHASLSALRAAETGRPVVQAALTGDSVAFDARGRLLASAGPSRRGAIVVSLALPPASARTLYDRLGDYVPWTAIGILVLAALLALARGRPDRLARIRPHRPARIAWNGSREPDRTARLAGASPEAPAADAQPGGNAAAHPRDGS